MKSEGFVIFDPKAELYLAKRIHYGYNALNQSLFKVSMHSSIREARVFESLEAAHQFLDELPPNENYLHLFNYPIRLAHLEVANLIVA